MSKKGLRDVIRSFYFELMSFRDKVYSMLEHYRSLKDRGYCSHVYLCREVLGVVLSHIDKALNNFTTMDWIGYDLACRELTNAKYSVFDMMKLIASECGLETQIKVSSICISKVMEMLNNLCDKYCKGCLR